MATWGGKRKGSGRPKGTKTKTKDDKIKKSSKPLNMTPLEYLTSVMNNPDLPDKERIRAAIAAARYSHKLGDRSSKEEKGAKAKKAGEGKFTPGNKPGRKAIK